MKISEGPNSCSDKNISISEYNTEVSNIKNIISKMTELRVTNIDECSRSWASLSPMAKIDQNKAQHLPYAIFWIATCVFFWLTRFGQTTYCKCHLRNKSSISDERARKVRNYHLFIFGNITLMWYKCSFSFLFLDGKIKTSF